MQSIDNEIWKPVVGYENSYIVSNLGRVYALERTVQCKNQFTTFERTYPGHMLELDNRNDGYVAVFLHKDGVSKGKLVHRLVAEAFIPNPDNLPEINHKDRNKQNNFVENLEWITHQDNVDHALQNGWNPHLSRLGATNSKEHRASISKSLKGIKRSKEWRQHLQTSHKKQAVRCRCIEDNLEFISFAEAGRYYGVDPTTISDASKINRKVYGKYTFERI